MTSSAEKGVLEHLAVSIRLRAPRVAIVVPSREPWQYFAGVALHRATTIWGGAGFILVPHQEGAVDPIMLRIASAYDPDHVVSTEAPLADLMDLLPELYGVNVDGKSMSSAEVRAASNRNWLLAPSDVQARVKVSAACTPYKESLVPETSERDHVIYLRGKDDGTRLLNVKLDAYKPLGLSYIDSAFRDCAVVAASRWGNPSLPTPSVGDSDLSDDDLRACARHIFGPPFRSHEFGHWPTGFQLMRGADSAWKPSLRGLTYVNNPRAGRTVWLVVGSEFSDFALSHALDRIDGYAVWLPTEWLSSDSVFQSVARDQLSELRWRHRSEGSIVRLVTVSDDLGLAHAACRDLAMRGWSIGPDDDDDGDWLSPTALEQVVCEGRGHLVLEGDYDRDLALPVELRRDGDCIFATPLPAITPETPEIRDSPVPEWHVDIESSAHEMPRGRGLTGEALYQETSGLPERLRSGRDGISLMSRSYGLIMAGATIRQSLARPKLQLPGFMSWVTTQANSSGLTVQVSESGHRANIAAQLWGNRAIMADDLLRYFSFFKEFFPTRQQQKTDERYPDDDGCILRGEGYLTFQAAVRVMQTSGLESSAIRDHLDDFIYKGVLCRGVILRCRDCAHVQWISLSRLDRVTPCTRCSAGIPLARVNWNLPAEEPRWFYDLHPVVRHLLSDHGDVAILAGRQLQSEDKGVVVLPELDFKHRAHLCEVDLVAGSRKLVAVGECKHSASILSSEREKKLKSLVQTAVALRADRVVLAAGNPGNWEGAFLDELHRRLNSYTWADGHCPKIQLMTGLRTATPQIATI